MKFSFEADSNCFLYFQEPYEDEIRPVNHYESEYVKLAQRKSASIKKIEDEYCQMKAALLSSMDSEDEQSDADKDEPKLWEGSIPKPTERDNCPTTKKLSDQYKTTPSIHTNLDPSENRKTVLSISHGKDNQIDLESKRKLGSSNADIDKHEDVLDRKTSSDGSYGLHLSKGRFCYPVFLFLFSR